MRRKRKRKRGDKFRIPSWLHWRVVGTHLLLMGPTSYMLMWYALRRDLAPGSEYTFLENLAALIAVVWSWLALAHAAGALFVYLALAPIIEARKNHP